MTTTTEIRRPAATVAAATVAFGWTGAAAPAAAGRTSREITEHEADIFRRFIFEGRDEGAVGLGGALTAGWQWSQPGRTGRLWPGRAGRKKRGEADGVGRKKKRFLHLLFPCADSSNPIPLMGSRRSAGRQVALAIISQGGRQQRKENGRQKKRACGEREALYRRGRDREEQ
jgi:hypothetical protein